ncbi:alpha/beta fold hydrolase [Streptomyces sp. NPDC059506]|uniref:alpha/beta fold hydrolase n=1 Tax=Streptomyces TaxID=1883 RepID=UPI000CACE784|nr:MULTISPECIES: alpha/beta fold hydrolase [unclassified Streptomyces]MCZ2525788.1 alpha/beta fold hydrolase [Streptomyces sp. HB2AG]PLW66377.1 alpha/beta hydrolase [Streptomyces sp. DJ]QMV24085.1 alpha/beta fold hydrolase [Streptomyces sp. SCUT-3]
MDDHLTADTGRIRLAHRVLGAQDAPPVVLLHGLGGTAASWDDVAGPLSEEHRVHVLELRGHGNSDWPGTYSFELMRDDVLAFLDTLGLERVDLVGHSMGGTVALLLAQEQPDRVGRLVLEEPAPPWPCEPLPAVRPAGELPFDWPVVPAIKDQLRNPDPSWRDALKKITAPTLVVAGGAASHVPQQLLARLAEEIPDARLVTMIAGHLVHDALPAEFTAAVRAFLAAS